MYIFLWEILVTDIYSHHVYIMAFDPLDRLTTIVAWFDVYVRMM